MKSFKFSLRQLVSLGVSLLLGGVLFYFFLPAINFHSLMFLILLLICLVFEVIIDFFFIAEEFEDFKNVLLTVFAIIAILVLLIILIGSFTSFDLFRANSYYNQITIEDGDFKKDVPLVENVNTDIPIVDTISANQLGDRKLGDLEQVSQFDVDEEYNLIIYKGDQYRLSPLNYGGFFKFFTNKDSGIPGYILVNTITQETTLVKLEDGIKYSPSAKFSKNLERHLRFQYPTSIFGKSHFEIDEDGLPFYVTPVESPQIGLFGGKVVTSAIITNASTGESIEYALNDIPSWVDHLYGVDYLKDKAYKHYQYVHGFINLSSTDEKTLTDEYTSVIINNEVMFLTGVTSVSSDNSIIGFIFMSAKTEKTTFYPCSGALERSAQNSAEGLVQNLGYIAGYPIIINVNGVETYFMTLKDNSSLVKKYAMVNVKNYTLVSVGDTASETITSYNALLKNNKIIEGTLSSTEAKKSGTISELYSAVIDSNTFYFFKIEEDAISLYKSSIKTSEKQVLLKVGSKISFEYTSDNEVVSIEEIN